MRVWRRWASCVVVGSLAVVGCSSSERLPRLDEAIKNQPAELVESGESFIIGDAKGACGFPRETRMLLLDADTGGTRWDREVPWAPSAPIVLDGVIVSVSRTIDENPPSLAALNLGTGAPRWQRFLAAESLEPAGAVDGAARVLSTDRMTAVDVEGAIVDEDDLTRPVVVLPTNDSATEYVVVDSTSPVWSDPIEYGDGPGPIAAVGDRVITAADDRVSAFDEVGQKVWESEPIQLDSEYSKISDIRANDQSVVVLIGSDVGPNRRLVVLDPSTGAQRWSLTGIRDVTPVGDFILYDVRSGTSPEEPTRETVLVDSATGAEQWRVQSSGTLGGYVGSLGTELVFAGREDSRLLSIPVTGPEPDTVLLGSDVVDEIYRLTDSEIVRGSRSTVTSYGEDGLEAWSADVGDEIQSLTLTDAGVVVTTGDSDYGCD